MNESEGESEGFQFVYENNNIPDFYHNDTDNYWENYIPHFYDYTAFNYYPFMNQEELFYLSQNFYYTQYEIEDYNSCFLPTEYYFFENIDIAAYQSGEVSNSNETNDESFDNHSMMEY
ncbi:14860_t:CDS:1 [Funneliformis geosporum]|nr:14860_t:CDS:1 [Funneliformis geosporum]